MNQLGLIVILTISIVTMAVFQGYTGSLVDKRSASASSGADIQIIFSQPVSKQRIETLMTSNINKTKLVDTLNPSGISSMYRDRFGIQGQRHSVDVVVLSANHRNVLHWQNQTIQNGLDSLLELSTLGFTSGAEAAKKLDLAARSDKGFGNIGSPFEDFDDNDSGFDSITLTYPYGTDNPKAVLIKYIGGHRWVPGAPQGIQPNQVIMIEESTFRSLNNNEDYLASYWFVELCDENTAKCRKALSELNSHLSNDPSVVSVRDWDTQYNDVSRMGGLIFGTPGILSLQYIVATFATLASSMVFLSLILARRKRELAILQSIGASTGQLSCLVIFEIISIFTFSLILGGLLGIGLAQTFTGLFSMFGALFQFILQSQVLITRELVWPWPQVILVNGLVFVLVWLALLATTLRAIRSDLPTVLKEE